jgi:hypothetical protein
MAGHCRPCGEEPAGNGRPYILLVRLHVRLLEPLGRQWLLEIT